MKRGHNIFVLTGAGISAESGIPVFQGTSWRGHNHYQLANIDAWESDPQLIWQYYSDRRRSACDARANTAHNALTAWAKWPGPGAFFLFNQNVATLNKTDGSTGV